MRKSILRPLTLLFLVCLLLQPMLSARAEETEQTGNNCSLTLTYAKEGQIFPNCEIEIFRVAERLGNGSYRLVSPFTEYPVRLDGITSQKEWQDTANTLEAYVTADWITPTRADKTDDTGTVSFQNLQAGLYLIYGTIAENNEGSCQFVSTLILLPRPQSDGSFSFHLSARPKGAYISKPEDPTDPTDPTDPSDPTNPSDPTAPTNPTDPTKPDKPTEPDDPVKPEMQKYQVVKLWKDSGYSRWRPTSVTVEIFKNGVRQETVELSTKNSWTYSWEAPVSNDTWTVLERNVAENYTVTITSDGQTFTITNSRQAPAGSPPKTGDSFPFHFLSMVACLSGMLLMILGIWYQRKFR